MYNLNKINMIGKFAAKYLKNKLIKETMWSFATLCISFMLFFSLNVFLSRSLGVEKFGIWSFFYSIFSIFLMISFFGINASTKKYVAQYNAKKELKNVLSNSFKLRLAFSLFFSLLMLMFYNLLAMALGRPEYSILFLLSAPLILFAGLNEFLKEVFRGLHRIKYNFIINTLEYSLKLMFVFIFFNFSLELYNIVNSFIIATFISTTIGLYLLYKNFYNNRIDYSHNFTRNILNYSFPMFFLSIGFLIATEVDTVMLGLFSTNTQVGLYAVAKQLIIKLPHIALAISMGTMPVFAKMNRSNQRKLCKLFNKLLKINALIFGMIVFVILLFSKYFIPFIYCQEYIGSVLPLQILTGYLLCYSFSLFLGSFLNYRGLATKTAINMSISIICNIILNIILIPQYGATGAAVATTISYIPYVILNWLEVRKVLE